jgi:hypothetical protein
MSNGQYDQFTQNHIQFQSTAHNSPNFLVWHCAMLRELEKQLQAVDPTVCLHYWAWDVDSQAPEAAAVWAADAYGGSRASNGCVSFPWAPTTWQPTNPNRHCLRRDWSGSSSSLGAFATPELINSLITRSNSYESFRQPFESTPHGQPHVSIGGDMATMGSPNDPIFYGHHVNVDRWYAQWQSAKGDIGRTWPGDMSTSLAPYPYTVQQVMDTSSLCYTYAPLTTGATATAARRLMRRQDDQTEPFTDTTIDAIGQNAPDLSVRQFNTTNDTAPNMLPGGEFNTQWYAPENRNNLRALRYPTIIPATYIQMMNFSEPQIRQYETETHTLVDALNRIPGYASPLCLMRRSDLLSFLYQSNPSAGNTPRDFFVDITGKGPVKVDVRNVQSVLAEVLKAAPEVIQGSAQTRQAVVQAVGTWTGDKASVANFELAAQEGAKVVVVVPDNAAGNTTNNASSAGKLNGKVWLVGNVMLITALALGH